HLSWSVTLSCAQEEVAASSAMDVNVSRQNSRTSNVIAHSTFRFDDLAPRSAPWTARRGSDSLRSRVVYYCLQADWPTPLLRLLRPQHLIDLALDRFQVE